MEQQEFPFLIRMNAPAVAHPFYVARCKTYREAVRLCWAMRRVKKMTQRQLAAEAGLRPQLISDYLHADDAPTRRELPGELIAAFENVTGNTLVSQWVANHSQLTVLEEMQAAKVAQ